MHVLALPFTHVADELGDPRAGNMVMLGALLEMAGVLPQASVDAALRRLVKSPRWVELDEARPGARNDEGVFRESLIRRCEMKPSADPDLIVYFGGKYVPLAEARVGILTHALHYGTGVFEGIRAHWDEDSSELFVLRPQEHYERWKQNCGILRIDVPPSAEELCAITVELMRRNRLSRPISMCGRSPTNPLSASASALTIENAFAIVALPFGEYLHSDNGLHAGVSSWRRIEDAAIPVRAKICGAYANSALASDDARRAALTKPFC